jgi:hypothetical protein
MRVKLDDDQMDEVVKFKLVRYLRHLLDPEDDIYETFDNRAADISAFCGTLRYFTTEDEYNEIIEGLK